MIHNGTNQRGEGRQRRWLSRFLYVVGVQSVRILKRIWRRLKRQCKPVAGWCVRSYESLLQKRVEAVKAEWKRIQSGFSIACSRIRQAKQAGAASCIAECVKVSGKSVVRHKKVWCGILNVAAPLAAIAILLGTVHFWTNQKFGLVLAYGNQEIAVEDEGALDRASEMVNERLVSNAMNNAGLGMTPKFSLAMINGGDYASSSLVCDQLIQQTGGKIEQATGLYVDNQLIGAVKSGTDLKFLLQSLLNQAKGEDASAQAAFVQKVETITGLFPTSSIISSAEMKDKLNQNREQEELYTAAEDDTLYDIAIRLNMDLDELMEMNPIEPELLKGGDQLKIKAAKPFLTIQVTKEESYQQTIPYKTVTVEAKEEYTDYSQTTQTGVNGLQDCVDKVVYIDGQEVSRESVSRTVVQPAVDETVVKGVKTRPSLDGYHGEEGSGVSSGSLMWPLPYTHSVTSYYEMRWGRMHNGIDIASGGVYGQAIVAADGGVVTTARYDNYGYGYHVEIDHGNGITTLYGHASSLYVTPGQRVSKGQVIAAVGSTGNSTGPHLHFEVYVNGSRTNPLNYVS